MNKSEVFLIKINRGIFGLPYPAPVNQKKTKIMEKLFILYASVGFAALAWAGVKVLLSLQKPVKKQPTKKIDYKPNETIF